MLSLGNSQVEYSIYGDISGSALSFACTECDGMPVPIQPPIYQPVATQPPVVRQGTAESGANDNKGLL